jgi:hypothetical protein
MGQLYTLPCAEAGKKAWRAQPQWIRETSLFQPGSITPYSAAMAAVIFMVGASGAPRSARMVSRNARVASPSSS